MTEALTREIIGSLSWKILYAHDLMLVAESIELLEKKLLVWKEQLDRNGMRLNEKKTRVKLLEKNCGKTDKGAQWMCVMCGKGVGSNSI